jgi:hemolysin-activating ACP:hemolysin acyltransferase
MTSMETLVMSCGIVAQTAGHGGLAALSLIIAAFRPAHSDRARRLDAAFNRMVVNLLPFGPQSGCLVADRGPQHAPVLHFCSGTGAAGLLEAAGDVALAIRLALGRGALRGPLDRHMRETAAGVLAGHLRRLSPPAAAQPHPGPDALWPWLADEALWGAAGPRPAVVTLQSDSPVTGKPPRTSALAALERNGADILASPACAGLQAAGAGGRAAGPCYLAVAVGAVARLLAGSAYHRQFDPARYIADEILPAFAQGQAIVALGEDGTPRGLVTWARISPEVEAGLHRSGRALLPVEWASGTQLFFNDWITQDLPVRHLIAWLRSRFPDRRASSLRRRPDRTVRRINDWHRETDVPSHQDPDSQAKETTA